MITAAQIKWVRSLHQKKYRKQQGLFLAEGDKIVKELLSSPWETVHVFALSQWLESTSLPQGIMATAVSPRELQRISTLTTAQQALAVVKTPVRSAAQWPLPGKLTLLLDHLRDPGNLGTIIRTADWFGVKHIVCTPDTADLYNPKVIQATMGSFIRVQVEYHDPEAFLKKLPPRYPVMAAMLEGEDVFQTSLPAEGILIIGNESRGVSPTIAKFVNQKIFIPRGHPTATQPESLNAAVAAGIILSRCRMGG